MACVTDNKNNLIKLVLIGNVITDTNNRNRFNQITYHILFSYEERWFPFKLKNALSLNRYELYRSKLQLFISVTCVAADILKNNKKRVWIGGFLTVLNSLDF